MQHDSSYDPAFQAAGHNISPNMTNTGTAFKTNVHRQKTRKWVEAKAANYDGDDWGDEYVDDDIEPPMPSNALPALPKLQQHQFRYQQQQKAENPEIDTVKILPQGSRRNGILQSDTTDSRSLNPTFEAPHVTNVESSGQLLVPSRSGLPDIVSSLIPSQRSSLAPLSPNTVTIVNTTNSSTPTSSITVTASKPTAHPEPSCISSVTRTHSVSSDLYLNFPHHSITTTPAQLLPTQHQPPVQSPKIGDTSTGLPSRITSLTGSGSSSTSHRPQPLTKLQSSSTDTHIVPSVKSEYRRLSEIKPREISRSTNLDRVVTEGSAEDSHRSSTSPQLPDVARMSMFAVDFDSSFVAVLEDAPPLPSLPPLTVSKQDTQVTPITTMSEKLDTKLISFATDTPPALSISQEPTQPPLPPLTTSPTMAPASLSTSFDNPSSDSPRNSSTSTHTESPIKESDRLREEIMQSLDPFSTLSPDDQTKPSRQSTRESNYLPSLYDDYWASTVEDVDDSRDHTVGLGLNNSVVAPLVNSKITADGDKSRSEEKISVEPESLISSNSEEHVLKKTKTSEPELSGPKRFSWEAVLESPLNDIGELSTGPSSPSYKTSSPTSADKHISDAQNTPGETHNGDTKPSSTLPSAPVSQVIRSMLDVDDVTPPTRSATTSTETMSQKDVCQSHELDPNQPEISLSKYKETSVTEPSLEDGKPSVSYNIVASPAQIKDVFGSLPTTSATVIESPPSHVIEPVDLRQMLHGSVSSERVKDMTEARGFYYKCNTGLSHWISSMISEYPEYRLESRVFSKSLAPALLTTHVVTAPPLSAGLGLGLSTAPNAPYSPTIFDHSVPSPNPVTPSFTTSTSGGFRSSPGGIGLASAFHIPTSANDFKQSSTKGKDFLLAAGKAGKGLLNKGKHKFRGEKDVETTNLEMVDSEWPCKIATKPELYTHPLLDDQDTIIQCRQYLKSRSLSLPTLCLSRSYTEIHSDFGPARVLKISGHPGLLKNNRSRSTSESVLSIPGYRPHNSQDIHRSTEKGPLVNTSRNVKDLGARVCEDGIASHRQQLSGSSTGFGANPTNQVQSCDIQLTEQSPSFDKPSLVRLSQPSQSALTSLFSLPLCIGQSASQHTVDHSFDLINPTLAHEITPVVMAMGHDNSDETHAHSISPFSPPLGHIRPDGWIEVSSQVDLPDIRPGVSNTSPIAHSPVSPIFKHGSLFHQVPKSTVASPPVTTTQDIVSPTSFVFPESLSQISYETGLRSSPGAYDINDSINGRNAALFSLIKLKKNGSQSTKPEISNNSTLGQDALDSKGKECVLETPVGSSDTLDLWNDKTPVNLSTTGDHASLASSFQSRRQSIATAVGSPASSSHGRTRRPSTQITIQTDLALPSISPGPPLSLENAGPSDNCNMMPNSLMPSALVNNSLAPVSPAVEEFLRRAGHGWEVQESHLAEPLAFSRQRSVSPARQTPHELSSFDKEVGEHCVRPSSSDSSDCEDSNINIAEKADESGIELPPSTNVDAYDKSPPSPVKAPRPSTVVFNDSRRISRMFSMPLEAYRPSPSETMVTQASYSGIRGVSMQTMSNVVPDGPNSVEPHPQRVRKQTSMFVLRGSPAHMSSPVGRDNYPYPPQSFMPRPLSVNARHSNTHSGLRSATSPLGFGVMNSDSIPTPVNKSRFSGIANFFKRSNASSKPRASKRGGTFREASMSCADLPVSPYSQSLTNISRPMSQGPLTQWELDTSEKRSSLFSRLTRPNSRSRPTSATPDNRMYSNIIPTHSSQDSPYPLFYGDRPSSEARQSQTSLHLGRLPAASRSQGTLPATPEYRNSQSIIATTSPRSSLGAYSQFRASDQFPGHVREASSISDRNGRVDLNDFMAGNPHVASGYTTAAVLPSPLSEAQSFAPSSHSASGNWATSLGSLHSPDQDIPHSAPLDQNRFHTPASSTPSEHLHIGDSSTQLTTWLSNNQTPNRGSKDSDLPSKPAHKSLFTGFKRRSKDAGTCMASHTTSSFKFKPFSMKSRTGHTPIHHEHESQFQLSNTAAIDPLQHGVPSLIHNHSMPLLTNSQCGISNLTPDCLLVGRPPGPFCNRAVQHHIQFEHSSISHNSLTLHRQNTSSSPMHHYESVVSGSHCDPVTTPSAQNHVYVGTPYPPSSAHVFPSTSVNAAPQHFASQCDGSESEMSMSATAYPGQEWVPYVNPDESD